MGNKTKRKKQLRIIKLLNLVTFERQMIYLAALALFFILNFSLSPFSFRLDLSNGKAYTLSQATKKILRNLDDIVIIKFFASSGLPVRLTPLKTEVVDLLNEYKKNSGGKIRLKIVDPKKDTSSLEEARELGIPEIQFSQLEKDKYAVTAGYFGIAVSYGDKRDLIPQVTAIESLEYNLTALIYKMTRKEQIKIGMVGASEAVTSQDDQYLTFKKLAGLQFNLQPLDISSKSASQKIDKSYRAVIVFDTDDKRYTDEEIKKLKRYLEERGKILFFVDGVWISDSLTATPADHNLFSLLSDYAIRLEKDLLLSTSAELVNFGGNQMSLLVLYPFWLRAADFNQKTSYFSNIHQLTYPWVSSLVLDKKNDFTTDYLVKTSNKSWRQKDNFNLNPQTIPQPQQSELKQFIIGAQSSKKNNGEIVVIPSSRFIQEKFLGKNSDNLEFILNILNNLTSGGALTGIRSRSVIFYPLPDLPETQKDLFRYINILLLPSIFAGFGLFRLIRRR